MWSILWRACMTMKNRWIFNGWNLMVVLKLYKERKKLLKELSENQGGGRSEERYDWVKWVWPILKRKSMTSFVAGVLFEEVQ